MAAPDWIWFTFVFCLGCCIGSFLNVVIYRLPREKSLVHPGSACPSCNTPIRFYNNIPLVSWLLLGAKCPNCKASISARYFVIEFITGVVFLGVFIAYFNAQVRLDLVPLIDGGWLIYLLHIVMLAAFIAASAIDLELWIIPLSLCWFVTGVGLAGSALAGKVLPSGAMLITSGPATAALATGSALGLIISLILLKCGLIRRSYDWEDPQTATGEPQEQDDCNHRREACLEIVFLTPVFLCALGCWWASAHIEPFKQWWGALAQCSVFSGFMGSLWGYFIGCTVVWATRILGTLGFGKEAMGLGDVHLMGAAGAIIGASMVTVAFFIAPFFGLGWALFHLFFKRTRQIPYGPFLSLGVFTVMIFHDWIVSRLFVFGV